LSKPSLLRTTAEVREMIAGWRAANQTVALVPTMGNLHAGHLGLADLAARHADRVVMTIFVNPTQFGVGEDFAAYPRTLDEDHQRVEQCGSVDVLFVPDVAEIYPAGIDAAFKVVVPPLGAELCGANRPGHFDGVASVVLRLLNIVAPDFVVLGRKDYQQLLIVERMIADLRIPVQVIAGETKRHEDGLAISSRNAYLTPAERASAPNLRRVLSGVRDALASGQQQYSQLESMAIDELESAGFRPDYVEVRVAKDLAKPNGRHRPDELIVLGAAWLGKARLIDNLSVRE
jgi:pantoate--beta-alanine ligase